MRTDPSRLEWRRLGPGVLLLAAIAATVALVFFLDEVLREVSEGPRLHVAARHAPNLEPGAEVWVAGVPAGRVVSIGFRYPGAGTAGDVLVETVLEERAAGLLRADASALIRESALLEPGVVAIRPGSAEARFDFSDTLLAEHRVSPADVLARADSLRGRLEALRPLAERFRARLEEGPGTLASLRRDGRVAAGLGASAAELRRWEEEARGGSVALLARDSGLAAAWGRIRARADTVAAGFPRGRMAALAATLDSMERHLAALGARLEEGRGSAGRFVSDAALERERRRLEAGLAAVKAELLREPLRWLRLRLF